MSMYRVRLFACDFVLPLLANKRIHNNYYEWLYTMSCNYLMFVCLFVCLWTLFTEQDYSKSVDQFSWNLVNEAWAKDQSVTFLDWSGSGSGSRIFHFPIHWEIGLVHFYVRQSYCARYSYRLEVCPSVRPSVSPSHADVVSKRLNLSVVTAW